MSDFFDGAIPIVCSLVAVVDAVGFVPDSNTRRDHCRLCGAAVYVGPCSVPLLAQDGYIVACGACVAVTPDGEVKLPPGGEALAAKMVGPELAARIREEVERGNRARRARRN